MFGILRYDTIRYDTIRVLLLLLLVVIILTPKPLLIFLAKTLTSVKNGPCP